MLPDWQQVSSEIMTAIFLVSNEMKDEGMPKG
jgi:hypothetical protein